MQNNFSFGIFFSLIGIGLGLCGVIIGIGLSPEAPQYLLQYRGLLIVFGGLLSVLFMAYSVSDMRQSLVLIWETLIGSHNPDREGLMKESLMLATRSRESEGQESKFFREIKPYISHSMLQAGVELLIAGYSTEMIQNTLQTRREQENLKFHTCIQILQSLMHAAWLLGLAGGASALMRTQLLSKIELLPAYMSGIAVPIVAGLLLSALLFYPLLRQMQLHQHHWSNYLEMSIMAVLLLQARHHALFVETVLKAYLPIQAVNTPPVRMPAPPPAEASKVKRSSFQAALDQESDTRPSAPLEDEPDRTLSVDELRRFRPVQRHEKQDRPDKSNPSGPRTNK